MNENARKALFVAVTVVLGVLALFAARGAGDDDPPPAAGPAPAASQDVIVNPDTAATADGASSLPMPLTGAEIDKAASVAAEFTRRYTTYRYDQNDAKVLEGLSELLGRDTSVDLSGVLPTGTLKATLVKQRYTATSTAKAVRVLTLGDGFAGFEVKVDLTARSNGVTTTSTESYFVAVTEAGGWVVADLDKTGSAEALSNKH